MQIVVHDLCADVGLTVDKVLVTLDLLAVPRSGSSDDEPRPFFGFKPSAFEMLKLVDDIASVLPEEFASMKEVDKRQKPFGDNNILVHTDNRNNNTYTYPHKLLTFFVKKVEGEDAVGVVGKALSRIGDAMMHAQVQQSYQDILSINVSDGIAKRCPPIKDLKSRDLAQSIYVNFFAALKKADVKVKHNLRFNLTDETSVLVVKNFFSSDAILPAESLWHQNLKHFVHGGE